MYGMLVCITKQKLTCFASNYDTTHYSMLSLASCPLHQALLTLPNILNIPRCQQLRYTGTGILHKTTLWGELGQPRCSANYAGLAMCVIIVTPQQCMILSTRYTYPHQTLVTAIHATSTDSKHLYAASIHHKQSCKMEIIYRLLQNATFIYRKQSHKTDKYWSQ